MASVDDLWRDTVRPHLASSAEGALSKKQQQDLAAALQEWSSQCIWSSLEDAIREQQRDDLQAPLLQETWHTHHLGKDFIGGVRLQEIDVWLSNVEAGLVLAVDPKHFQSEDSLNKNWKNGHNDLVALATNIHERSPLCAVGGIISFPKWAASARVLKQMRSICGRSIPRPRALNAYGKFEGFGLAIYGKDGSLDWPFEPDSPLKPEAAFRALADAMYARTIALL